MKKYTPEELRKYYVKMNPHIISYDKKMKISGFPCPECGTLYYALPICDACGWKDEEFEKWCKEQLEIAKQFEGFLTRGDNKT